jgi:DeoR/GlpR family transcriptional regulator of sugar metabolism
MVTLLLGRLGSFYAHLRICQRIFTLIDASYGSMHFLKRRKQIYGQLLAKGEVLTRELVKEFGVAHDTVYRDYLQLSKQYPVKIIRGGALLHEALRSQSVRQTHFHEIEPDAIALNIVIKFVQDGKAIILDGGRSTILIAQQFPLELRATVVTNSPQVAAALARHPSVEVIVLGGRLRANSLIPIRPDAYEYLSMIHADLCIMSECSVDSEKGLSISNIEEVEIKRMMISQASELIIIATSNNINHISHFNISPISKVKYLVPDETISDELLRPFIDQGVHILGKSSQQQ